MNYFLARTAIKWTCVKFYLTCSQFNINKQTEMSDVLVIHMPDSRLGKNGQYL